MRNISDIIEGYLKQVLELGGEGHIEIKRSEIADKFQCVPSQINYVINTRFTAERGYLVEGGASQTVAEGLVYRLIDEQVISKREAKLMLAAVDRSTLDLQLPLRDSIRAKILRAMLTTIKYEKQK